MAVPKCFAAHAILLQREGESDKGGGEEVVRRAMERVEATVTDPDANVLNTEEVICSSNGKATVFARTEEKEIGQEEAVARGENAQIQGRCHGIKMGSAENNEWKRFDTRRRAVLALLP